jgi:hypothetical protein
VSCKNGQNDPSDPSAPAEYGPIEGNISKPDWKVSEDYDMSSSMTAIVKVEKLNGQTVYDKIANDKEAILAGFAGEECLGIAQADSLTGFFFLYLCEPTKEEVITLKYYSSVYKNIFVDSYAFSFVNDDKKGSVKEPYLPSLWAIKK